MFYLFVFEPNLMFEMMYYTNATASSILCNRQYVDDSGFWLDTIRGSWRYSDFSVKQVPHF